MIIGALPIFLFGNEEDFSLHRGMVYNIWSEFGLLGCGKYAAVRLHCTKLFSIFILAGITGWTLKKSKSTMLKAHSWHLLWSWPAGEVALSFSFQTGSTSTHNCFNWNKGTLPYTQATSAIYGVSSASWCWARAKAMSRSTTKSWENCQPRVKFIFSPVQFPKQDILK